MAVRGPTPESQRMKWISTRGASPPIPFIDALFAGTAPDGGLYVPERVEPLPRATLDAVRDGDLTEIASSVGAHLLRGEISELALAPLVRDALDFPVPLVQVTERVWALELFHGPTLAFKDVGARVQARLLHYFTDGTPLTILVATSGDTGSAVAQAFYGVPDTRVMVLYPEGQVTDVQEAQMASLGGNITAVAVRGTFDDCQRLVKQAFADDELRAHVWLTPANSINLGRLLPQVFYYFVMTSVGPVVVSVPSGNFGNLTAGLIAKRIGLPVSRFVAATNVNDVVPEYLRFGPVRAARLYPNRRQRHGRRRPEQLRAHPMAVPGRPRGPPPRCGRRGVRGTSVWSPRSRPSTGATATSSIRTVPLPGSGCSRSSRRTAARKGYFLRRPIRPSSGRWSSPRSARPCRCRPHCPRRWSGHGRAWRYRRAIRPWSSCFAAEFRSTPCSRTPNSQGSNSQDVNSQLESYRERRRPNSLNQATSACS